MIRIIKKSGKRVNAYRLGDANPILERLIREGKIIRRNDGSYRVMSQETVKGETGSGEKALAGDFIKIDGSGFPYPNAADFFQANHKWISGDEYEQIPKPLAAWTASEPVGEEIEFLIKNRGLVIDKNNEEKYFTAPLWGTIESASKDAVVVFYQIIRDAEGHVKDADFNFVCRSEFEKNYILCLD